MQRINLLDLTLRSNLMFYSISIAMLVINLSVAAKVYSPHSATCSSGAGFFLCSYGNMVMEKEISMYFKKKKIYKNVDISFSGHGPFLE